MIWNNEIESAKSLAELKTSKTTTGAKLQTNPHGSVTQTKASGFKKIINGDFKRSVFLEEAAQKAQRFLRSF